MAKEKKRKHSQGDLRGLGRKRRSTESSVEDVKGTADQVEAPAKDPTDLEEGGLDLTVPFKSISDYMSDRHEMLEQCFRVLGENKLKKMLPDELKDVSFEEIKTLCRTQLEQLSPKQLLAILEGRESTPDENEHCQIADSQQDNNVDSTSSVKDVCEADELKKGDGSGEESDVLSINADADDSDIEGSKDSRGAEVQHVSVEPTGGAEAVIHEETVKEMEEHQKQSMTTLKEEEEEEGEEPRLELQQDIDRSVSEILTLSVPLPCSRLRTQPAPTLSHSVQHVAHEPRAKQAKRGGDFPSTSGVMVTPAVMQPSAQQLELLELEMRARAIKALMKANETKKQALGL